PSPLVVAPVARRLHCHYEPATGNRWLARSLGGVSVHPVLAEICRAKDVPTRTDVLRRWQQALATEVQPLLDRLATLEAAEQAEQSSIPARTPAPKRAKEQA